MGGQNAVANQGFFNHDTAQIWKYGRFDRMAAFWVFSDSDSCLPDLVCYSHFDAATKLASEVTTNVSPVFPGEIGESNPHSSRGSVKKSGGQSNSLVPFASLNFFSRAGMAK